MNGSSAQVSIAPGNPTNFQLAAQLSANTIGVSVGYDAPSNTLRFVCADPLHISCSPTLGATLGFPTGSSPTGVYLTSAMLRPPQLDQVVVRLEGMDPWGDRYNMETTTKQNIMDSSTMLCAFTANGSPYTHITYQNICDEFELLVEHRHLNTLRLQLTDYQGVPLTYLNDHTLVLRVRTFKEKKEEMLNLQQEMVGLIKDQLLAQQLGF